MSTDKQKCLLDELQNVLEKQIDLARCGNIRDVEILSQRSRGLAEKITDMAVLELPEFENRRHQLRKSYQDLCLALAVQKAEVATELGRVRKGRKAVGIYRNNI